MDLKGPLKGAFRGPSGAMLCYAMLCYAMLCYAMLRYALLCYAMLCRAQPGPAGPSRAQPSQAAPNLPGEPGGVVYIALFAFKLSKNPSKHSLVREK